MKIIDVNTAIAALPIKGQIHCYAGSIGADWTKRDVLVELKRARKIGWIDHWSSHDLAIETGPEGTRPRMLCFDIRRPPQ